MQLRNFEYRQHVDQPEEWRLLPFSLKETTLLVGRNAAGKSRTLSVMNSLAKWLRGTVQLLEGTWDADFEEGGNHYRYELQVINGVVRREQFTVNMEVKLERFEDGKGKIASSQTKSGYLDFQIPPNTLAVVQKRDLSQALFLEPLHQWAESLRYYPFGEGMGKTQVAMFHETGKKADPTNANEVVGLLYEGIKKFSTVFENGVIEYMRQVGYDLESIRIAPLANLVNAGLPLHLSGIAVKEIDLKGETTQLETSSGMFRTLSIIVHIMYSELASRPATILIDDIGEGLDYERATALIRLLCDRSKANKTQLVMSTNDRFVMNDVPLEYWAVIVRKGWVCQVHNQDSDPQVFKDFKFTGLSNFDLFRGNMFESVEAK